MELENRTRGSCARPANGSLIHLSGSPIADTVKRSLLIGGIMPSPATPVKMRSEHRYRTGSMFQPIWVTLSG